MMNLHWSRTSNVVLREVEQLSAFALVLALGTAAALPMQAQTFTVLYSFHGQSDSGAPWATLIRDSQGNLYGTASYGSGSVYRLSKAGRFKVLHQFDGHDGQAPYAGVIRDEEGNLYGTTHIGGAHGDGTVFKLDKAGKETVLHSFDGSDGSIPYGTLIRDVRGSLYGTTLEGGPQGLGTVFKITRAGKYSVIYSFQSGGESPFAGVTMDSKGHIYGTTALGGYGGGNCIEQGCGTVFRLDPNGGATMLYRFTDGTDGAYPLASLITDKKGNLFGTASNGGDPSCDYGFGCGTVFRLDNKGRLTPLYAFTTQTGGVPEAPLVQDAAGNLFGTAYGNPGLCGGQCGVVFKIDTKGKEIVLHSFTGHSDGGQPIGGLVLDEQGNLYGTASAGGMYGQGTVFKITP